MSKPALIHLIPSSPGVYVLLCVLEQSYTLRIGALATMRFEPGPYAYVGSALGGLRARLSRHLGGPAQRPRWHIDYLLQVASPRTVMWSETQQRRECSIAHILSLSLECIKGFGSSDCRCRSHLFFGRKLGPLTHMVRETLLKEQLRPHILLLRGSKDEHTRGLIDTAI